MTKLIHSIVPVIASTSVITRTTFIQSVVVYNLNVGVNSLIALTDRVRGYVFVENLPVKLGITESLLAG